MTARGYSAVGAALLACLVLAASPAGGEGPTGAVAQVSADPFSALVGKRGEREPGRRRDQVMRYSVASDGRHFLVEGRLGAARIKFLCAEGDTRIDCTLDPASYAEEIHLASASRGPRGDVIYKDQAGDTLLRIASYGGATVYWPGRAGGEAASKSFGDDASLTLPAATRADAERRATGATARLSALTGEPIEFMLPPKAARVSETAADERVLADAIVRAAAGMIAVAGDPTGARVLGRRVSEVRFVAGEAPRVAMEGRRLEIVYDPFADAGGRPSSRAIAAFLEDSL